MRLIGNVCVSVKLEQKIGYIKNNPTNNNSPSWINNTALPFAVAAASVVVAPIALSAVGFGAGGIVAGSWAAKGMSAIAVSNGVGASAGSFFAACQSAGAVGIASNTLTWIGALSGSVTAAVQKAINNNKGNGTNGDTEEDEESEEMMRRKEVTNHLIKCKHVKY
ncbi:interferon alpha-inducible protein 27-like protein 2 isoform X2 [Mya arenaria]|uniref:interferon alpha-inducible protein 27-like protein 2 isoform X2 n=1 Tax=Mya arenaria TaxID=6604 RepID=UPI0022DFF2AE|nr:interferon alpha-inducible protein 27-like protein 2 isoform X2 [Mya arenaria]